MQHVRQLKQSNQLLLLLLLLIWFFVTIYLVVECRLFTVFFNYLSLVEQGSPKFVGCGKFSVLHSRQINIQPLVIFNAIIKKNCAISVAICSLNCLFSLFSYSAWIMVDQRGNSFFFCPVKYLTHIMVCLSTLLTTLTLFKLAQYHNMWTTRTNGE